MGRVVVVFGMVMFVAGCASRGAGPEQEAADLLRMAGSLEPEPRDGSEQFVVDTIAADSAVALRVVRVAYTRLSIPLTVYEPAAGRIAGYVRVMGDHGGERPSKWVDCGQGATAEKYADAYDVSLAIGTRIAAIDAERSEVRTVIRARARARDVSSDRLRCRSFGTLESRIVELAAEQAARVP